MGRRFRCKEKENHLAIDPDEQDEELLRQHDIMVLRRVRARMHRTQRNIAKLNENLRFLRRCAINCLDIVDNAVDVIEHERQENRRMLQLVEQDDPEAAALRRERSEQLRRSTAQIRNMLQQPQPIIDDEPNDDPIFNSLSDSELMSSEEESVSSTHSA